MKKIALAAAIAAVAAPSTAATYDLSGGALQSGVTALKTIIIDRAKDQAGAISFSDSVSFRVAEGEVATSLAIKLTDVVAPNGNGSIPGSNFNIASFSLFSLDIDTDSANNNTLQLGTLYSGEKQANSGTLSFSNLAQGTYYILVSGEVPASATKGGKYSLSATATTAPVPEPGEWAMLLAGLGVVGFVAKRRRKVA